MANCRTVAALAVAALGLSACDNEADKNPVDRQVDGDVAIVLTPAQQANVDAFDEAAFQREYGAYRDKEAIDVVATPPAQGDAAAGAGDTSGAQAGSGAGAPPAGGTGASGLRPRYQMDFAYLDRNDDGQLSVAEYAIWSVPVDPNEPKRNDETKPYLTSDQANQAAQSFFYYDKDGNTYLSEQEFQTAKTLA